MNYAGIYLLLGWCFRRSGRVSNGANCTDTPILPVFRRIEVFPSGGVTVWRGARVAVGVSGGG
ncbi:hypothetical protein CCHOA_00755 [Corynebacterium choanae]|uniref:Uncharacterized protein n=1 Tax=Corynebacterium choanae TaxID=1862358 RepID=A0A3G6J809_9CORY|nr:hypothetical protein CCHOA_00755 [Corynebacterium choanae]